MKSCIALFILFTGMARAQQPNIIDWFPIADSMSQFPPVDQQLSMAEKRIDSFYVTFVGVKDQPKVLLAAVTREPIKDVKSISLVVQFDRIKPKMGNVTTWAYVFDRNHDGKIDYMAMIESAAAYEGDDMPENYPKGKTALNIHEQEYFVSHARLFFTHWADDNYDGKFDAVIVNDLDPDRDMVLRQIVVRSSRFNSVFDDVWSFRLNISGDRDSIAHSTKRVPYRTIGNPNDAITSHSFLDRNAILNLINRAAKELNMDDENFYHPEESE